VGSKVSTLHKGLWFANKSQAPPTKVSFKAPGSFYRFTYLRNEDEYSQPKTYTVVVGAGDNDHFTTMRLRRARKAKGGNQSERGVADAIGYFSPFPIRKFRFAYTIRNAKKAGSGTPGEGMCEFLAMCQETGGELWTTFLSDKAVNLVTSGVTTPSDAATTLTSYGSPNRVAFALIPNGGDEIPANDNNTAEVIGDGNYWAAYVDTAGVITETRDFIQTPPTWVQCYDLWLRFNTGGVGPAAPYHRIDIGGPNRRIFLPVSVERIKLDCARKRVTLVDASGVFIRNLDYVARPERVITSIDGGTLVAIDNRWLPLPVTDFTTGTQLAVDDPSSAGWGTINFDVVGRRGYGL
jgi:hypothetical protein